MYLWTKCDYTNYICIKREASLFNLLGLIKRHNFSVLCFLLNTNISANFGGVTHKLSIYRTKCRMKSCPRDDVSSDEISASGIVAGRVFLALSFLSGALNRHLLRPKNFALHVELLGKTSKLHLSENKVKKYCCWHWSVIAMLTNFLIGFFLASAHVLPSMDFPEIFLKNICVL